MIKAHLLILSMILFVSSFSFSQNSGEGYEKERAWGIGIRMGDPIGLTIKKRFSSSAIEFNTGGTLLFAGRKLEDKLYAKWYDKQGFSHYENELVDFFIILPISFQLHYLFQKKIDDEVQYYFGGGIQIRHNSYRFDYRYKELPESKWKTEEANDFLPIKEFDTGLDITIGIEYSLHHIPLTLFGDILMFLEIHDEPIKIWPQGGIGFRINF